MNTLMTIVAVLTAILATCFILIFSAFVVAMWVVNKAVPAVRRHRRIR